MVGRGAEQDRRRRLACVRLYLHAEFIRGRRGRGHDVAVVVPARRQRAEQGVIDSLTKARKPPLTTP